MRMAIPRHCLRLSTRRSAASGPICGARCHLRAVIARGGIADRRYADPYGPPGVAQSQRKVGERAPGTPRAPTRHWRGRVARRARRKVVTGRISSPLLCQRDDDAGCESPSRSRSPPAPWNPGAVRTGRAQGRLRRGERDLPEARTTELGGVKDQSPHIMRQQGERVSSCVSPRGTRS